MVYSDSRCGVHQGSNHRKATPGHSMKIQVYSRGVWQILKIEEDLKVIADLSELQFLVEGYVKVGKRHIAVSFTNSSYIYSGALAVLIECYRKIKDGKGELCLIEPNDDIRGVVHRLGVDRLIKMYESEEELP